VLASKLCKRVYNYIRNNPDLKSALYSIDHEKHPTEEEVHEEMRSQDKTHDAILEYLGITDIDLRSEEQTQEDKENNALPVPKHWRLPWKESLNDYMFYL
jgi:hypothetical protein